MSKISIEAACAAIAKAVQEDPSILRRFKKPSKGSNLRQNLRSLPEYIHLVIDPERLQICGCFYLEEDAEKYRDNSPRFIVQKLPIA